MEWIKENRKLFIIIGNAILVSILIASLVCFGIATGKSKTKGISYDNTKDLEYNVLLKKNNYYDNEYIEKDNQYIASLIDTVNANFKYSFNLNNAQEYDYKYEIEGVLEIVDGKNNKTIYSSSENIMEETGHSDGKLDIDKDVTITYDKYNNLANEFISVYELKNVYAKLNLNLNLNIEGTTCKFSKEEDSIMSLSIPLGENTIDIESTYSVDNANNFIAINDETQQYSVLILLGVIFVAIDLVLLLAFLVVIKLSETEEDKYKGKLKKIITNYDSCISKVEDDFNMEGYQILRVTSFVDLLEIRDTMHLPIIMLENKKQLATCFVIPTSDKILYFYSISVKQYALPSGNNKTEEKKQDYVESNK